MSTFLMLARIAVLVQSITLYPVLLFIVRSQLFTAFVYKRARDPARTRTASAHAHAGKKQAVSGGCRSVR